MARGLAFAIIGTVSLVFVALAFATDVYWHRRENALGTSETVTRGGVWYQCQRQRNPQDHSDRQVATCVDQADPEIDCNEIKDKFWTTRAFYMMTGVFVVFAMAAGSADHYSGLHRVGLVIFALLVAVFSLVGAAVAITIPRYSYCGNDPIEERPNFRWGPSPFMMIVVTALGVIQLVVALVVSVWGK